MAMTFPQARQQIALMKVDSREMRTRAREALKLSEEMRNMLNALVADGYGTPDIRQARAEYVRMSPLLSTCVAVAESAVVALERA